MKNYREVAKQLGVSISAVRYHIEKLQIVPIKRKVTISKVNNPKFKINTTLNLISTKDINKVKYAIKNPAPKPKKLNLKHRKLNTGGLVDRIISNPYAFFYCNHFDLKVGVHLIWI